MNPVYQDVSLCRLMEKALTQFKSLFLEMLTPFLPRARQLSKDSLRQFVLKSSVEFWLSEFHGYVKDSSSFTESCIFDLRVDRTAVDVAFHVLKKHHH